MALWVRGDLCVSLGHAAGRSIEFVSQQKLAGAVTELIGQPEGSGAQRNKRGWCRQSAAREQGDGQRASACAGRQKQENCLWCCESIDRGEAAGRGGAQRPVTRARGRAGRTGPMSVGGRTTGRRGGSDSSFSFWFFFLPRGTLGRPEQTEVCGNDRRPGPPSTRLNCKRAPYVTCHVFG
jgi:hypothetical protein